MIKKRLKIIFVLLISNFVILFAIVIFFLFTNRGNNFIIRKILPVYSGARKVSWKESEGNFSGGMTYDNFELIDLDFFPKPNRLQVQKVVVDIEGLFPKGIAVQFENAKLYLPDSEMILCSGIFKNGFLDVNIYSNDLNLRVFNMLVKENEMKFIEGGLSDIDLFVSGSFYEPKIEGCFRVSELWYKGFSVADAHCRLQLNLRNENSIMGLYGKLFIDSGFIKGNKTAVVTLRESYLLFSGDPEKPDFFIKGKSEVGKLKMDIVLQGDFNVPSLQIESRPQMEKERLLFVLATNKAWYGADDFFNNGEIPPELACDFIDYFVFGNQGGKFVERFGINSVLLTYNGKAKGVGLTKNINDKLSTRYSLEQTKPKDGNLPVRHTVGIDCNIKDDLSVNTQTEFRQDDLLDCSQNSEKKDGSVSIKIKKLF
ncbi:MAG: translocation/assembly module TamB domain-containing protein [Candidatus Omnitrophota bacterium]